jgi:hypothetical protein
MMVRRVLTLVGVIALFGCFRSASHRMFDRGWSNGWEEGFVCGISATPEFEEMVFPSADMEE